MRSFSVDNYNCDDLNQGIDNFYNDFVKEYNNITDEELANVFETCQFFIKKKLSHLSEFKVHFTLTMYYFIVCDYSHCLESYLRLANCTNLPEDLIIQGRLILVNLMSKISKFDLGFKYMEEIINNPKFFNTSPQLQFICCANAFELASMIYKFDLASKYQNMCINIIKYHLQNNNLKVYNDYISFIELFKSMQYAKYKNEEIVIVLKRYIHYMSDDLLMKKDYDIHLIFVKELVKNHFYQEAKDIIFKLLDNFKIDEDLRIDFYELLVEIAKIQNDVDFEEIQEKYSCALERFYEAHKDAEKLYISIESKLLRMQKKLEKISYAYAVDDLTQCLTKDCFKEHKYDFAYRKGFLAFLDLNELKKINDSLGHNKGDELIRRFGKTLNDTFKDPSKNYRVGGDEFIILVPDISRDEMEQKMEQFLMKCQWMGIKFSAGIAILDPRKGDIDQKIQEADRAMYKAKEKKESRFVFFE